MKIELSIDKNGYIKTLLINNKSYRYYTFNELSDIILKEKNFINTVKIENGNIYLKTDEMEITIKNYCYNKNKVLKEIIDESIKIKSKERYEYLKQKQITRRKAFAGSIIISLGVVSSNILIPSKEKNNTIEIDNTIYEEVISNKDNLIEKYSIGETKNEEINDKNIPEDNKIIINDNIKEYTLNINSRVDSDKFINTKNNYYNLIKKISSEYGIDPQIMLAIATQESGKHIINENLPAMGLMQIEISVWNNEFITAYNYQKQSSETVKITKEKLKDLEFNIRVACMHFQNCLKNANNDLLIAIQMYNYGYGNMRKVLNEYRNNSETDWLNCRKIINVGDSEYVEHVLSYIEDIENIEIIINNEKQIYKINDINNVKKM